MVTIFMRSNRTYQVKSARGKAPSMATDAAILAVVNTPGDHFCILLVRRGSFPDR
jgi:hypothetical protein